MRQCPGIYFADEPSGRTATIGVTGLSVWESVRDFNRDQDAKRIRKAFPRLSQAQITAALMYHARYGDEVQAQIDATTHGGIVLVPSSFVATSSKRSPMRSSKP